MRHTEWHLPLCVQRISLNMMSSSSIYSAANDRILFFLMAENYSIYTYTNMCVSVYITLFLSIHQLMGTHADSYPAIMKKKPRKHGYPGISSMLTSFPLDRYVKVR